MEKDIDDRPRRTAVCPHCAGMNLHSAVMCRHCMGPLMSMENTSPMGTVFARGDVFAKASRSADRPLVLAGMWVMFGPLTMMWLGFAIGGVYREMDSYNGSVGRGVFWAIIYMIPATFFGVLLWKTTRNYFRNVRIAAKLCVKCGYDLRASEGRCPECGERIAKREGDTG